MTEKLKSLGLVGAERVDVLASNIKDVISSDGSDVSARLGGEDSDFYNSLKWAADLLHALQNGLEDTLLDLQKHRNGLASLPDSGSPHQLKTELADQLSDVSERLKQNDFFKYSTELASHLTAIKSRVRDTAITMQKEQAERINDAEQDLVNVAEWQELTVPEQQAVFSDLENLALVVSEDLVGLRQLVNQEYNIQSQLNDIKQRIVRMGQQRVKDKLIQEQQTGTEEVKKITRSLKTRARITNIDDLKKVIAQLEQMRQELQYAHEFELLLSLDSSDSDPSSNDKA